MGRILIFTGKGGVGKTSIAAAHACQSAQAGYSTLIVSTDMAHNLFDLFKLPPSSEIQSAAPHLDVLEINPDYEMATHFTALSKAIDALLPAAAAPDDTDELLRFPGIEELFSLLRIKTLYESGCYDRILIDCAPTGETLALLKFPELLSWYMEKLLPLGKLAMRVMRPISKKLYQIELPDKHAMNDIEALYLELAGLQTLLKDRRICSVRIVTLPEKMVVEETKRSYMYLSLYNFYVDGVIINRILPETLDTPFFDQWQIIQKQYIAELEAVFAEIPILRIPWYETELTGIDSLNRIADGLLQSPQLFDIKADIHQEVYEKSAAGYTLKVWLPGADKHAIDLHTTDSDVILRVGNFKRSIPLPQTLRHYRVVSAKMAEHTLCIAFEPQSEVAP